MSTGHVRCDTASCNARAPQTPRPEECLQNIFKPLAVLKGGLIATAKGDIMSIYFSFPQGP